MQSSPKSPCVRSNCARKRDPARFHAGDEGAVVVAGLLATVTTLRHVNMQCTELSESGARELLAALPDDDPQRCFELAALCTSKISQRVPHGVNLSELSGSPRGTMYIPRYFNYEDEF